LYLRLNGYLASGFIVHAPLGESRTNRTQIDALAVRFPNNQEPEREVEPSEYLQVSRNRIDVLVCEVKGGRLGSLQFNDALRNDSRAVKSILRWIGLFPDAEVEALVDPVSQVLQPLKERTPDTFPCHEPPCRDYRIRGILFAPDRRAPRRNQVRYICGDELVGYIWRCIQSDARRSECSTKYDFGLWGPYEQIIRFFKQAKVRPSIQQIYAGLVPALGTHTVRHPKLTKKLEQPEPSG